RRESGIPADPGCRFCASCTGLTMFDGSWMSSVAGRALPLGTPGAGGGGTSCVVAGALAPAGDAAPGGEGSVGVGAAVPGLLDGVCGFPSGSDGGGGTGWGITGAEGFSVDGSED